MTAPNPPPPAPSLPVPPEETARQRLAKNLGMVGLLAGAFALIVWIRALVLFALPYPPSGDVAEQLYWSHLWLGTAFPSQVNAWWVPPVYIFLVYIPFTHLFPLFTGQRLLMAVVPALLLFPAYLLLRVAKLGRYFAFFGAALLAVATPFSLMVTWNAGYNLFGIFWALLCFAGLLGALRTHRWRWILLASVAFGLTAGAHDFTFVFLCVGFLWTAVLSLLLLRGRRRTLRTLAIVLVLGIAWVAPFSLVYLTLTQQTANVGGAVTLASLVRLGEVFLPFAWTGATAWSPFVVLDAVLAAAGFVVLLAWRPRAAETPVLLAILLSGATLSIAYPQEADRGLYFLPLGLYPLVAVLGQWAYETSSLRWRLFRRGVPLRDPSVRGPFVPPPRRYGMRRARRWVPFLRATLAVGATAGFLVINAQTSLTAMASSGEFYQELQADDLPVLNWLSAHTAENATVFSSSAGLEKWIWGYANRQAYAPTPLDLQATSLSYQETYLADLAAMGQYVAGNQYLAVANNFPTSIGTPLVYLRTSSDWSLFLSTGTEGLNFTFVSGGGTEQLSLASAVFESEGNSTPCLGCVEQIVRFAWPWANVFAEQETTISGSTVSLQWLASGGNLTNVGLSTYLPPSGLGVVHLLVPDLTNASTLRDHFNVGGDHFELAAVANSSGAFSQTTLSTGWTAIGYSGPPRLSLIFYGLRGAGASATYSVSAPSIFQQFGVNYVVTDYSDSVPGFGYLLYLRCETPVAASGLAFREVFRSGPLYVFAVSPLG